MTYHEEIEKCHPSYKMLH